MRAMVLHAAGTPLDLSDMPNPVPGPGQLLISVNACGVCRTDLHLLDGELPDIRYPIIPGHEIVGTVVDVGPDVESLALGDRVGVPWLGSTCGLCVFCREGQENLCDHAVFTGYQANGGYAEYCVADERFCFPIPAAYTDVAAAPLLCAGLIGYRSLRMATDAQHLGLYGFGAAAHIVAQIARFRGRDVYAFTRPADLEAQRFARSLGAVWAGGSDEAAPHPLDAAIVFAPVGQLVPAALGQVRKGGTVVCAGIHMTDIPAFPYSLLWGERVIRSVANLTRDDGLEFFQIAPQIPVRTRTRPYPLAEANEALRDLRNGRFQGAAVLVVSDP